MNVPIFAGRIVTKKTCFFGRNIFFIVMGLSIERRSSGEKVHGLFQGEDFDLV